MFRTHELSDITFWVKSGTQLTRQNTSIFYFSNIFHSSQRCE